MKKSFIVFFSIILLMACSSDDNSGGQPEKDSLLEKEYYPLTKLSDLETVYWQLSGLKKINTLKVGSSLPECVNRGMIIFEMYAEDNEDWEFHSIYFTGHKDNKGECMKDTNLTKSYYGGISLLKDGVVGVGYNPISNSFAAYYAIGFQGELLRVKSLKVNIDEVNDDLLDEYFYYRKFSGDKKELNFLLNNL